MIVSLNPKKFIFIHVPKCAGTSIISALNTYLSRNGINYFHLGRDFNSGRPTRYHVPACEVSKILERFSLGKLNDYFSFAFVGNPWRRMISIYTILNRDIDINIDQISLEKKNTLKSFDRLVNYLVQLDSEEKSISFLNQSGSNFFKNTQNKIVSGKDNKIILDYIGRLELLDEDFDEILNYLGINKNECKLPRQKLNQSLHKDYKTYYTNDLIEKVYSIFKDEVDFYGFNFDSSATRNFGFIHKNKQFNEFRKI